MNVLQLYQYFNSICTLYGTTDVEDGVPTFTEEKLGLPHADFPLCRSDLHLEGSCEEGDNRIYISFWWNGDSGTKLNKANRRIKLLSRPKHRTISQTTISLHK